MKPQNILVLDTCERRVRVALVTDGAISHESRGTDAATMLPEALLTVLDEAHLPVSALDLVVATRGPGSFTGIKIGLSVLWGFTRPAGVRAIGVDRLHALAESVDPGLVEPIVVAVPAWAGMLYSAVYRHPPGSSPGEPRERAGSYLLGHPDEMMSGLPDRGTLLHLSPGDDPLSRHAGFTPVTFDPDAYLRAMARLAVRSSKNPDWKATTPLFLRMTEKKAW